MKSIIQAKIPKKLRKIYEKKYPIEIALCYEQELLELEKYRTSLQNELDMLTKMEKATENRN